MKIHFYFVRIVYKLKITVSLILSSYVSFHTLPPYFYKLEGRIGLDKWVIFSVTITKIEGDYALLNLENLFTSIFLFFPSNADMFLMLIMVELNIGITQMLERRVGLSRSCKVNRVLLDVAKSVMITTFD